MTRVLLLSPHPDDIAWSLGATTARLRAGGAELFALTFFGDTRYAPGHPAHGGTAVTAVREAEERAWAEWAGVRLRRHLLPDASLRGYDDDTEMGAEPETDVVAAVRDRLREELLAVAPSLIVAPLAVGGHIDHSAVRHALSTTDLDAELVWYEDLPYAEGRTGAHTRHPVVVPVTDLWHSKETGVRHFPSQLPERILPVLARHCDEVGGERLWAADARSASKLSFSVADGIVVGGYRAD